MIIPFDRRTYVDTSKPYFWSHPNSVYPFGFYITSCNPDENHYEADRVEYIHAKLSPDLADKFLSIVSNFPTTNPEYFL